MSPREFLLSARSQREDQTEDEAIHSLKSASSMNLLWWSVSEDRKGRAKPDGPDVIPALKGVTDQCVKYETLLVYTLKMVQFLIHQSHFSSRMQYITGNG